MTTTSVRRTLTFDRRDGGARQQLQFAVFLAPRPTSTRLLLLSTAAGHGGDVLLPIRARSVACLCNTTQSTTIFPTPENLSFA